MDDHALVAASEAGEIRETFGFGFMTAVGLRQERGEKAWL
jgi:hypothetical protein